MVVQGDCGVDALHEFESCCGSSTSQLSQRKVDDHWTELTMTSFRNISPTILVFNY